MNNQFVLPREAELSNFATNAKAGPRIQSRSNALPVLTGSGDWSGGVEDRRVHRAVYENRLRDIRAGCELGHLTLR